jgi:uncharacterized cupredoxin-like copper-binding protein
MRLIRFAAPLILVAAVAACSGSTGASPSGGATTAPTTAPSVEPSMEQSASPSASAMTSPSASASASGTAAIEIIATDYAFSDPGADLTAPVSFTLRNDGAELHELVVVRRNDGVTTSWEELLALPEDQAFAQVQFLGQTMAEPGQTATTTLTATEPGEYLMVCFIPQGTTAMPSIDPAASGPPEGLGDGPPHFTLGMMREFTIAQ